MSIDMTKVWAHRGASAYAPENTIPAFQMAMEMGADGLYRRLTPGKNAPLNSQEYFFRQAYEAVSRGNQTE